MSRASASATTVTSVDGHVLVDTDASAADGVGLLGHPTNSNAPTNEAARTNLIATDEYTSAPRELGAARDRVLVSDVLKPNQQRFRVGLCVFAYDAQLFGAPHWSQACRSQRSALVSC